MEITTCDLQASGHDGPAEVNIEFMRAFIWLRRMLASHEDLARKLDALEKGFR
jgi:hypothetical protein